MPFNADGTFSVPNNIVAQYNAGQKFANPAPLDENYSDIAAALTEMKTAITNTSGFIVSATEPTDTSALWIRPADRLMFFHDGTGWQPVVGVYSETTGVPEAPATDAGAGA